MDADRTQARPEEPTSLSTLWRRTFRPGWRARLETVVDSEWFQNAIMAVIIVNAAMLGLETFPGVMRSFGGLINFLDVLILTIFVTELGLRIAAKGTRFFQSGWSWFDLIVVVIAFAPSTGGLSALRALRVLRVLRLVSISPKMRRVVYSLFASIPGMATVLALMLIVFYVAAVIATQTFGAHPSVEMQELYGTLGRSFFTLFQLMTLEDWAGGIVQPTMERFPYALLFFLPYIFLTAFAILNLFIGIIVDGMQEDRDAALGQFREEEEAAEQKRFDLLMAEIQTLRREVADLKEKGAPPPIG
ncbi:MAG: ion transporter [Pseudomonadota bacterium]